MRIIIRLAVLALAAVGAKALYDRFAPRAADLREPVSGVLDTAKSAARDVTDHAKDAAGQVVDDAKTRAAEVRDEARDAADTIGDVVSDTAADAPTVATTKS
jgi:F0F1-type ATP synthase membrane subunit b/b'